MKGQLSFIESEFIRDSDFSVLTLVKFGKLDEPVYGMRKHISPRIAGRTGSSHFERIYLNKLFPLEEYDLIVILFLGGKDSTACYYKLLEMGVPKEKKEYSAGDRLCLN
jgi:hypothetical protein